jgi:long-chain-alcohol oxidase
MAIAGVPREFEREQFRGLIEAWDTIAAGEGAPPFTSMSQEDRERTLLSWADSEAVEQRAAFQALRKGTLFTYYSLPWTGEGPNPIDEALGYPGPLGPPQDPPPKTIETL